MKIYSAQMQKNDSVSCKHRGFTLTEAIGNSIAAVTGCNGSLSGLTYTTGPITAACNVDAAFIVKSFDVTTSIQNATGGTISTAPGLIILGLI